MIWQVKPEYLEGPPLNQVLRIVALHDTNNDWLPLRADMVDMAGELKPGQLEFRR
jgi:hypothetical protein